MKRTIIAIVIIMKKLISHMKKSIITSVALLLTWNVALAGSVETAAVPGAVSEKLPAGYIAQGGLIWSPVTSTSTAVTLAEAKNICASSTALGYKWRLPTKDELISLTRYDGSPFGIRHEVAYRTGVSKLRTQGWTLHDVWSSTPGTMFGVQFIINLEGGIVNYGDENGLSHVTCVK
jgi:hypothetical protein